MALQFSEETGPSNRKETPVSFSWELYLKDTVIWNKSDTALLAMSKIIPLTHIYPRSKFGYLKAVLF